MIRKLLTSVFSVIIFIQLSSQSTYTSANYGVAGDSLYYSKVTLDSTNTYNFAQAGANVNWNFSTLTPTTQFYFDFLVPGTAGYRASFINTCVAGGGTNVSCLAQFNSLTNVAFRSDDSVKIANYTLTNLVAHDEKTANHLVTNILGLTARVGGANVPFAAVYTNPDVVYVFPISYSNRDSSRSSYTINLTQRGINLIYKVHTFRVNHAEAWGNISSPYATYNSTVRLRTTILHTDTLFYNGTTIPVTPYTDIEYSWFDPAYKAPVFTASGRIGAGGQERITQVTYLDTVVCLSPQTVARHTPLVPTINPTTGRVTVNFSNTSVNTNSYYWNFGDTASGNLNTSTLSNPSHIYHNGGLYHVSLITCNTVCIPERCDTTTFILTVYDSTAVHARFIANPPATCLGDSVLFNNTSTHATSYLWNFGDQSTSTATSPSHIYTQAGRYVVVLYAYNGTSTDSAKQTITVQTPPAPVITNTGLLTFCNGDSVTLVATGGTVYHWSNGRIGSTILVKVSGSYSVTATNSCGSASAGPVVVTVNTPVDTIIANGNTTFCQGDSVLLQANTGNGLTYRWKRNGLVIVGATQSFYYAKTSGNYLANVIENGCVGVSNIITVIAKPAPVASISTQSSTVICSTDSLLLTAAAGNGDTYQWQLNGQAINGATQITHYANQGGSYTVVVTRNGCSTISNGITVTENQTPAPSITYTGNGAICQGDSLQLNTATGNGYTYQWMRNAQNIPGATSTYYYASSAANYKVVVTNNGCSGTSNTFTLVVNPAPTANAGADQSLVACSFSSVTIGGSPTASGGTGPYNYLWTPASSLSATNVANPDVSNLGATTVYSVMVTDNNGCTATDNMTVNASGSSLSVSISSVGPSTWCIGSNDSISMTAVPLPSGSYVYNWSPATYLSSANTVATIAKPTTAGTYNYTVLITDVNGCQASSGLTVQVNDLPVATITALDTTGICTGDSVHFAAAPGSGYTYQWLKDGNTIPGATGTNFATADSGTYSTMVSANGCSLQSNTMHVTVNPQPTAIIAPAGSLNFCTGGSVLLEASNANGYTYQWYENGQSIFGATALTYTAVDSSNYYAIVNLNGCMQQSNTLATSLTASAPDSIALIGPSAFCEGDSSLIMVPSAAGNMYQWVSGSSYITGATSADYYASASGTYYAIITTPANCITTTPGIQISVNQYPTAGITPNGNQTLCTGDSVQLTAMAGTGYTYQWLQSGNVIANSTDLVYTVYNSGTYSAEVTQNGCTAQSNSTLVTVNPVPAAVLTGGGNTICPGDTTTIYASTGTGYTYEWIMDGHVINGANGDNYVVGIPGDYQAVISASGCSDSSNVTVISYNPPPVITATGQTLSATAGFDYQWYSDTTAIPGASQQTYTPGASGNYSVIVTDSSSCTQQSAVYQFTYTSINDVKAEFANISVYPNPAHEAVSVILGMNTERNISIELIDLIGNRMAMVYEGKAEAGNSFYQLSLSGLAQGIYLLRFYDGKNVVTKKIVKE